METKKFYSNGKLMISGEYLVLKGAISLAVPLKVGQKLSLTQNRVSSRILEWKAWFMDQLLFETNIEFPKFSLRNTNNTIMSEKLAQILIAARNLNPEFLSQNRGYSVTTNADFDLNWGVGSSSSLISNIASWAGIDPFELNRSVFNGSGYDIACARAAKPILYSLKNGKPDYIEVNFNPAFASKLFFVYLDRKQDTRQSLKINGSRLNDITEHEINVVSEISKRLLSAHDIDEFEVYMLNHEKILGDILGMMPVKYKLFPDFKGEMKSLGAWGGDFILVSWKQNPDLLYKYFNQHGYHVIFPFLEFVKIQ